MRRRPRLTCCRLPGPQAHVDVWRLLRRRRITKLPDHVFLSLEFDGEGGNEHAAAGSHGRDEGSEGIELAIRTPLDQYADPAIRLCPRWMTLAQHAVRRSVDSGSRFGFKTGTPAFRPSRSYWALRRDLTPTLALLAPWCSGARKRNHISSPVATVAHRNNPPSD